MDNNLEQKGIIHRANSYPAKGCWRSFVTIRYNSQTKWCYPLNEMVLPPKRSPGESLLSKCFASQNRRNRGSSSCSGRRDVPARWPVPAYQSLPGGGSEICWEVAVDLKRSHSVSPGPGRRTLEPLQVAPTFTDLGCRLRLAVNVSRGAASPRSSSVLKAIYDSGDCMEIHSRAGG